MGKALIIVESPAKIKTLKKFLGSGYIFESSIGHIRDLPQRKFGVDIENDFEVDYATLPDKEDVVKKLIKAAKECDVVYLSPDPDREGEAIAWHIESLLPKGTKTKRVTFNSITKSEVQEALNQPKEINLALVNAQQARRVLDRIVGYKISPILARRVLFGKKLSGGGSLSAGRVQSVALKFVVDREKEIEAFIPIEYWNLSTTLRGSEEQHFEANLYSVGGLKVEKEKVEGKDVYLIPNASEADDIENRLKSANYEVNKVDRKEKRRFPVPPFITSTLQQEASRHFGFSAQRTMSIAQGLYEGIDMGKEGSEGLITYMRTDSVRTAPSAIEEARACIKKLYGKELLPSEAKIYSSKKQAQDAHECIRPTNMNHPPEKIQKYLTTDQFKLYNLIWRRFIASQMLPAVYDTVSVHIGTDNDLQLRATGSVIKFKGFLSLYEEKLDDEKNPKSALLPNIEEGQGLDLVKVNKDQAFTKPPPRYSEASLVKELERSGIGRPSTYASIMNKIQSRTYTVKEKGKLKPTALGKVTIELLEGHFEKVMDTGFTVFMEDELERVANDELDWKSVLKEFWEEFSPVLTKAEEGAHVPKVKTDLDCPSCGKKLEKIWAGINYFFGCEAYPDCTYRTSVDEMEFDKSEYADEFDWEQKCPKCSADMKVRHGPYGPFLGCTKYPDCRGIVSIPKKGEVEAMEKTAECPAVGCEGTLSARRSRFGKIFYSCSSYPDCNVIGNEIEDILEKFAGHVKTPYAKKTRAKKSSKTASTKKKTKAGKTTKTKKPKAKPSGPPLKLSSALKKVIPTDCHTRGEVVKGFWAYVKSNDLQDPSDKRYIVPDAALKEVLGTSEKVHMMKVSGLLGGHIEK